MQVRSELPVLRWGAPVKVKPDEVVGDILNIVYGTDLPTVSEAMWLGIVTMALDGRFAEVQKVVRNIFAKRSRFPVRSGG